jgi:hypothetical protein
LPVHHQGSTPDRDHGHIGLWLAHSGQGSGFWFEEHTEKQANFTPVSASHVRLVAKVDKGGFASAAEIGIVQVTR